MLQNGVYTNEYMDDKEKSNATTLREKWIKDTSQFNEYFIKNYLRSTNFCNYIFPWLSQFLAIFAKLNTREIVLIVKFAKIKIRKFFLQMKIAKINTHKKS